ncbi:hypothetical protein BW14_06915 [Bifidobacterium sp. UTBIF-68]|nr:hypothetical protein BW14_06915 [Bifidobacterium sp. UTBIF-68]
MYLIDIQRHIEDYITNCGFPVSDWDIDSWTGAARDYMDAAGIDSCEGIPEDIWTEMAIRFDVSEAK